MSNNLDILNNEYKLKSGIILPNRIIKAAMTEGLGDELNRPTIHHQNLYKKWTNNNAGGTLITGNILVDRKQLERPGNIAIEPNENMDPVLFNNLKDMVKAAKGKDGKTVLIAQLGNAGRQTNALTNIYPYAPSPIKAKVIAIPTYVPQEMTKEMIKDVVNRYRHCALVCKLAGFDGVQIHSAHGYLLSSFLAPRANQRKDEYGGSLENRARLLMEVIETIKSACTTNNFSISVKLNCSDFLKGGLEHEEAIQVAKWCEEKDIDFIEVSGGSYEQPSMM